MVLPPSQPLDQILLVEGSDEEHLIRQLLCRLQLIPSFSISDKKGIDPLLQSISGEVKVADRHAIGILADANDNVTARWNAITDRLKKEGIQAPASPVPDGTIIASEPRVGIWLMPNNTSVGELEDFVAQMIPNNDPVWPSSRRYIDGIPNADRKFAQGKILRAQIHAWLAARNEPRKIGSAIRTHDLEINGPLCRKFVDWLNRLFR